MGMGEWHPCGMHNGMHTRSLYICSRFHVNVAVLFSCLEVIRVQQAKVHRLQAAKAGLKQHTLDATMHSLYYIYIYIFSSISHDM